MIVAIVVILLMYVFIIYNVIIKQRNLVRRTKSTIEVYLTQRFDLIPNLVECVKVYAIYEEKMFEKITKLRAKYQKEKELENGGILNIELNKIMLILEKYPDLETDEQFIYLQRKLTKMENQIQAARRLYNNEVERYNNMISFFPNNILACIFKFKKEEFLKLEEN